MFKRLIELWRQRNTPRAHLAEQHQLLVKSARRCAYDLKHAADDVRDFTAREIFEDRAHMWLQIFSPDGVKDYRHSLHRKISEQRSEIERLKKLCEENGIDYTDPDGVPF